MKRSKINQIIEHADTMIREFGFTLPPFAYWSPDEFRANRGLAKAIITARCGWDITDYGLGDYDKMGLFLFTLRNGRLADLRGGGGMCYAEKLLIARDGQLSPMHTHVIKAEDIINRGGATLVVELFGSDSTGGFDGNKGGVVYCDGIARKFHAGEQIHIVQSTDGIMRLLSYYPAFRKDKMYSQITRKISDCWELIMHDIMHQQEENFLNEVLANLRVPLANPNNVN